MYVMRNKLYWLHIRNRIGKDIFNSLEKYTYHFSTLRPLVCGRKIMHLLNKNSNIRSKEI